MMMKLCLSSSVKMATTGGGSIAPPNMNFPSPHISGDLRSNSYSTPLVTPRLLLSHRNAPCLAVQESSAAAASASTVAAETQEEKAKESPALPAAEGEASTAKRKPPPKETAKALPELMEEDVIPSLKSTLEAQEDISELDLSFGDNRLEGSFLKKGNPYSFWAFFPDGNISGPKGFSLSSYGSTVSSVEPFLVDEKKVTAKLLVFWVEKRLAAQGIIPVWTD